MPTGDRQIREYVKVQFGFDDNVSPWIALEGMALVGVFTPVASDSASWSLFGKVDNNASYVGQVLREGSEIMFVRQLPVGVSYFAVDPLLTLGLSHFQITLDIEETNVDPNQIHYWVAVLRPIA